MPIILRMVFILISVNLKPTESFPAEPFCKPKILSQGLTIQKIKKIEEIFAFGNSTKILRVNQVGQAPLERVAQVGILRIPQLPRNFLEHSMIFMEAAETYYFPIMRQKLLKWKHCLAKNQWQSIGCTRDFLPLTDKKC